MSKRSKRGKGKVELYQDDRNLVMRYAGGAIRHYTRPRRNCEWRYVSQRTTQDTITVYDWVEATLLSIGQSDCGASGPLRVKEVSNRKRGAKPNQHSRGRKVRQPRTVTLLSSTTKTFEKFIGVSNSARY